MLLQTCWRYWKEPVPFHPRTLDGGYLADTTEISKDSVATIGSW